MEVKHIAFLVMPDVTLLDVTGPMEVFSQTKDCMAKKYNEPPFIYELHTIATERTKFIRSDSGLILLCNDTLSSVDYAIDTLFIPGISNLLYDSYKKRLGKRVLEWIVEQSKSVRRICSVCTGSFFLAEAGILNGKRATTHWELCDQLKKDYPAIQVESEPIFVKDGSIYSSAGITAGMDLALALIEADLGRSVAMEVAKQMVLYLKRSGNQSQFSSVLVHQHTETNPIIELQTWIQKHLKEELTIEKLAEKAHMSPRNFARVFVRETGITPSKYVDKLRIEAACRLLVETQLNLKEIAVDCGLNSSDNMRRLFVKYLQTTPNEYRMNFKSAYSS